jgi:hypothetical protein
MQRQFVAARHWTRAVFGLEAGDLSSQRKRGKMRSLLLASACTILTATSAAANQFSVRCEGGSPPRPYFATFDTERKITVLESSSIDPNTSLGSNPFAGELTQFKEQIELVLHTSRGTVNLIFDPRRNTMFWPSFNDTFRPASQHS